MSASHASFSLNPECIAKQGYLIKSPPLDEMNLLRKRWRKRWFVLYDTQPLCHVESTEIRRVHLYYYKTDVKVVEGPPKGEINLHGCEVFKQRGKLYGYDNVINLQTDKRLYHLCATQVYVCNEWFEELKKHHIPFDEPMTNYLVSSRFNSYTSDASHCRRRSAPTKTVSEKPIVRPARSITFDNIESVADYSSDDDDVGDPEYEYPQLDMSQYSKQYVEENIQPKMKSEIKSWLERTSLPIPVYKPPIPKRHWSEVRISEIQEDHYEGMEKLKIMAESEDEGIGRTDSESSSTTSSQPTTSFNQSNFMLRKYTPPTNMLSGHFVGPRFSIPSTTTSKKPLTRTRSLGDILSADVTNVKETKQFEF